MMKLSYDGGAVIMDGAKGGKGKVVARLSQTGQEAKFAPLFCAAPAAPEIIRKLAIELSHWDNWWRYQQATYAASEGHEKVKALINSANDWLNQAGEAQLPERQPVTITIHVDQGIVSRVVSTEPLRYIVVDHDTEGSAADDVVKVPDTHDITKSVDAHKAFEQEAKVMPEFIRWVKKAILRKDGQ
jgi:hypothetical protein